MFNAALDMLVLAENEFAQIITAGNQKYPYLNGGAKKMLHLEAELFQSEGCFYTRRTSSNFSARALPKGCVFSDKGPGITLGAHNQNRVDVWALIGVLNSEPFRALLALGLGAVGAAARSYETGLVETVPLPFLDSTSTQRFKQLSKRCYALQAQPETRNETSLNFIQRFGEQGVCGFESFTAIATRETAHQNETLAEFSSAVSELNTLTWCAYELDEASKRSLSVSFGRGDTEDSDEDTDDEADDTAINDKSLCASSLSYAFGVALGRWDIRYATGEKTAPELPDPFAPLPVCPPGQLQNAQGLPAGLEDVPPEYPVRIPWDGILVDDPSHPLDIERRVREVMEIICSGQKGGPTAEAIEHEACEILGVKSLRDYFRKSAGFFADHLKRYSKSRRQAPIYWPLSTASGSYTLWVYYHRLTDQTLHTCLADFLLPKIAATERELDAARANNTANAGKLQEFLDELHALREELERIIKLPWSPNLNDGVLITASPLWKLFRLPKWQKDLKACWEKLSKGEYDWAHLAHTIWPARVEKACETDRSLAIAHNLEHLCKIEAPKPKAKKKAAKPKTDLFTKED
jgi:hypothetical protein